MKTKLFILASCFIFTSAFAGKGVSPRVKIADIEWEYQVTCEQPHFRDTTAGCVGSIPTVNGGSRPGVCWYSKFYFCKDETHAYELELKIKSTSKYVDGNLVSEEKVKKNKAILRRAGKEVGRL